MKVTDLRVIKEPTDEWNVTQYYVVLDDTKQCITWWSAHYDDLEIGDDVELISESGDMKWKVDNNMMIVKKVKLRPAQQIEIGGKESMSQPNTTQSNSNQSVNENILQMAMDYCWKTDNMSMVNINYIYQTFLLFGQLSTETLNRVDEVIKNKTLTSQLTER